MYSEITMFTDPQRFVLIYGRSLLLDSVELTLRQDACPEPGRSACFSILRHANHHAPPPLDDVPPGVIIYDQDQVDETAVYQLLTDYPGWRLVGLTAAEGEVLIINSERGNGRSLADVINREIMNCE